MTPKIIFWVSVFVVFHTYILYPLLLRILASGKKGNQTFYKTPEEFPYVSILLAVFNEETIIEKKLKSLMSLEFPDKKLEILIASDASTDMTDTILEELTRNLTNVKFIRFNNRQGKASIINKISAQSKGEILVITDANIMHEPLSLYYLVRHFKNENIGLVDSSMSNSGLDKQGISIQEKAYVTREVRIKNMEGKIWGTMMGPSGGFYAVRKENFHAVPGNFLVDDFYINFKVLEEEKKSINDPDSVVIEDVSNDLYEEFRRKVRISAGNFQNLNEFFCFLKNPLKPIGFCFLSHKVLRWIGPFFILGALISNFFIRHELFYSLTLLLQIILIIIPFIDLILRKIKIHIVILRFVTHFYSMNLAILTGFLWFLKGIKSNVWEPTKRNQS